MRPAPVVDGNGVDIIKLNGSCHCGAVSESPGERRFCCVCGSALWVWDPRWPQLVHPFASSIDTDLPVPPDHTHMMLSSKPAWVTFAPGADDKSFDAYPDESLAEWHLRHGLVEYSLKARGLAALTSGPTACGPESQRISGMA